MGGAPVRTQLGTNLAHFVAHGLVWLLAFAIAGCAAVACRLETIVVARKDQTVRLETGPGPLRTTETGRLAEEVRPRLVREYWVQGDQGTWYQVTAEEFGGAEAGRALEMCGRSY